MASFPVDAARIQKIRGKPVAEALANWDRSLDTGVIAEALRLRDHVVELFPADAWPSLEKERYALGTEVDESFCKLMEFRTEVLGGIGGGSALKHMLYRRTDGTWYHRPEYKNEDDAWQAIRGGFVEALKLSEQGRWAEIDEIPAIKPGATLRGKAMYVYNSDRLLPFFGSGVQRHMFSELGGVGEMADGVSGSRVLYELAMSTGLFDGWSTVEVGRFLWSWSPRSSKRIVKIAPGHDATFWEQCRAGGYICVGWDEVGDLKQFESKEQFRQAFADAYPDYSPGKATEKANEVWRLMELQPGDIVLANQGTSRIMGIGEVVEPGYVWRPDRGDWAFHTVAVDWQDRPPWEIDPVRRWAMTTVSDVSGEEYKRILEGTHDTPTPTGASAPAAEVPPDPLLAEIADTIERKGQLILFGPPGTGKTYNALRFSVWWLSKRAGMSEANTLLGDPVALKRAEERFATAQTDRRTWWVVANPTEWSWDRLEAEGTVDYRYGRLQRNYPLVQPGDLVVGYSANPEKRITALARVVKGLHILNGQQKILLQFIANIPHGLSYAELLADDRLSKSEPIRFRNQGTLFALTADEADYLLSLLKERNPDLPIDSDANDGIGQLTRVTFHPSYSYEDFVEGFKPQPTDTGQLYLRLTDGVFKRVCRAAQADPDRPYLIVIDEVNRGNIPKIFGELITLLELDKRGLTVVLPQSRETFSVPANVHVLGTMNTADRSIKLLDAALRRRFAFIELMPDASLLGGAKIGNLDLSFFLSTLNSRVAATEGREKQIGHSFLLERGQPVSTSEEFARRFRYEILPLLQEYAYEDYSELESYVGSRLVNAKEQSINTEVLADPQELVDALLSSFQPRITLEDLDPDPPEASEA
jgi:5-methylcytosine-specific restriction protein B